MVPEVWQHPRDTLLGCERQTTGTKECEHKHGWCQNWGSVSTTNNGKKRHWSRRIRNVRRWHNPAREGGKGVKASQARSYVLLCSALLALEQSYSGKKERRWPSLKEDEDAPEKKETLHFWRWTQWQKWPKLFIRSYFGTSPGVHWYLERGSGKNNVSHMHSALSGGLGSM